MRKLLLLSSIIIFSCSAFAQVTVKLQQPPPNQLRASDIWKVNIYNPTRSTIEIILYGTLEESGEGIIVDGNSRTLKLPPGNKTITYDDVKSGNVNFKSGKWREAFTRTGNAPSGDYKICITVKDISGEEIGSDCIDQTVEIISSLTLLSLMMKKQLLRNNYRYLHGFPRQLLQDKLIKLKSLKCSAGNLRTKQF